MRTLNILPTTFLILFSCQQVLADTVASTAVAEKRPAYLSVPHWQHCATTETQGSYQVWCLPSVQPKHCNDGSWKKLTNKDAGHPLLPTCTQTGK